jgi:hypothetical protein
MTLVASRLLEGERDATFAGLGENMLGLVGPGVTSRAPGLERTEFFAVKTERRAQIFEITDRLFALEVGETPPQKTNFTVEDGLGLTAENNLHPGDLLAFVRRGDTGDGQDGDQRGNRKGSHGFLL